MSDETSLLPPIGLIHERLTRNERERRLLRTLQRLALREHEESGNSRHTAPAPRQPAAGGEVER